MHQIEEMESTEARLKRENAALLERAEEDALTTSQLKANVL